VSIYSDSKVGTAIPVQDWTGLHEVKARRFKDNRHMEVVKLSSYSFLLDAESTSGT